VAVGRGLSDLQRWILHEASTKEVLYYSEILVGFFGWEPTRPLYRYGEGIHKDNTDRPAGRLMNVGSRHFSPARIGQRRYASGKATLSRACDRLAKRGLVDCLQGKWSHWSGVQITDAGREWLSVYSEANPPQS
jgi:hypothetical protein